MTQEDHFRYRLRELRELAKLTREQLAEKSGFSVGGIRDLETGHRSPSWATALTLAVALGVGVEEFAKEPTNSQSEPKRGRPKKTEE